MASDADKRRSSYQKSLAAHGESPQALQWQDYSTAARRYRQLVADIEVTGKTVLDVGCGMGDLLPYLYAQTTDFTYRGIDITPEFIEIARKRYDGHRFDISDLFTDGLDATYDIVLCSGVLNAATPGWQQNRLKMIERLFSYAKEALVFNMAGSLESPHESHGVGYADARDILDFCTSLTPKVIFRNHYHGRDFTIALFK